MEAYEFRARDHAVLFACLARAVIRRFGRQGEAAVRTAVRKYGLQRGHRMALRTLRDGQELNVMNYLVYGEWSAAGEARDNRFPAYAPEVRMENHVCPWHQAWADSDLMEYGRLYCSEVDAALAHGYNGMTLELQTNLAAGDPFCAFLFRGCGLTAEQMEELPRRREALGDRARMPWSYHMGHLLRAVEETAEDVFGRAGREAVDEGLADYAAFSSPEAARQVRESAAQDFGRLPEDEG